MDQNNMDFTPSRLVSTFITIPQFAEGVMSNLSATYAKMITQIVGYTMTRNQEQKYLNILRDVGGYKEWIESSIASGCSVILIGRDLPKLVRRITDPIKFWNSGQQKSKIVVWLAIIEKVKRPDTSIDKDITSMSFLLPPVSLVDYVVSKSVHWYTCPMHNDNGIDTVFYKGYDSTNPEQLSAHTLPKIQNNSLVSLQNRLEEYIEYLPDITHSTSSTNRYTETSYLVLSSTTFSVGSCGGNTSFMILYIGNETLAERLRRGYNTYIKLYLGDPWYQINIGSAYIIIPIEKSNSDYAESTNMSPTTLTRCRI